MNNEDSFSLDRIYDPLKEIRTLSGIDGPDVWGKFTMEDMHGTFDYLDEKIQFAFIVILFVEDVINGSLPGFFINPEGVLALKASVLLRKIGQTEAAKGLEQAVDSIPLWESNLLNKIEHEEYYLHVMERRDQLDEIRDAYFEDEQLAGIGDSTVLYFKKWLI